MLSGIYFKMIVCDECSYSKAFNQKDFNINKWISEIASQPEVSYDSETRNVYAAVIGCALKLCPMEFVVTA